MIDLMSIRNLATQIGMPYGTIRNYVREEKIAGPDLKAGNRTYYSESVAKIAAQQAEKYRGRGVGRPKKWIKIEIAESEK